MTGPGAWPTNTHVTMDAAFFSPHFSKSRRTNVRPTAFRLACFAFLVSALVPRLSAVPAITSVANAASNITFNSPVAQGTVFVIKGSGLGPASISVASAPFQSTTLNGTSVTVAVGSTTINALMYYTSDAQVAALLPSNTPTGAGTFTVTYN